jgi:hypothetical protein
MTSTEHRVSDEVSGEPTEDVDALQRLPEDQRLPEELDPTCATTTVVGGEPRQHRDERGPGSDPASEHQPDADPAVTPAVEPDADSPDDAG